LKDALVFQSQDFLLIDCDVDAHIVLALVTLAGMPKGTG
jgi:hypothetical protein